MDERFPHWVNIIESFVNLAEKEPIDPRYNSGKIWISYGKKKSIAMF